MVLPKALAAGLGAMTLMAGTMLPLTGRVHADNSDAAHLCPKHGGLVVYTAFVEVRPGQFVPVERTATFANHGDCVSFFAHHQSDQIDKVIPNS